MTTDPDCIDEKFDLAAQDPIRLAELVAEQLAVAGLHVRLSAPHVVDVAATPDDADGRSHLRLRFKGTRRKVVVAVDGHAGAGVIDRVRTELGRHVDGVSTESLESRLSGFTSVHGVPGREVVDLTVGETPDVVDDDQDGGTPRGIRLVEKIVRVPVEVPVEVERIVERVVEVPVLVERVVEKLVEVERVVEVPVEVERVVEKLVEVERVVEVPVEVERVVEKLVEVERVVEVPVEVERIVERIVEVPVTDPRLEPPPPLDERDFQEQFRRLVEAATDDPHGDEVV